MLQRRRRRQHEARAARPRRRERARARDRARADELGETVLRILGHDLRTPLSAAALSAEVVLRTSEDARARRAALRVLSSTRRMERMIEQLLDYSRLRRGLPLEMQRRDCDLAAVCRAVLAEVAADAAGARLEFEERGDTVGEWDPERLAQLVGNLVANAVRHGTPGGAVGVCLDASEPDTVRVRVHNDGCIDPGVVPVLFEPFQATASRAAPRPGAPAYARAGERLGLGLFVARAIARAHGGDVRVATSDAGGTTLSVALPRRPTGV